jgi:two-component system sensor histidine kinase ChiS
MDSWALFYYFPDTLLHLGFREGPRAFFSLFFMLGVFTGLITLSAVGLLWDFTGLEAGPKKKYRARTVLALLGAAAGPAIPFIPAGNIHAALFAGALVQFAGLLGFETFFTLSALRRRFPWGCKQLLPLPLLAGVTLFLPLSGQLRAPLAFAFFSFALFILHATLFALEFRRGKRSLFFGGGALLCVFLGLAFILPPGPASFFWPAVLLAYLFLEYRLYPEEKQTHLLLLTSRRYAAGNSNETARRAKTPPASGTVIVEPEEAETAPEPEEAEEMEELEKEPKAEKINVPEGPPPEELPGNSCFIPKQFLSILNKSSAADLRLGDHIKQEMTIFFSDIRQFSALAEDLSPEENFAFINSYLSRIVPEITKNGGFVDSYIGDAILALFPRDQGPDNAVNAAVAIQEKIKIYNTHRASCGYRPLAMGIGLHTGTLIVGVVGTEDRMQSTVISDSVNLASRVESLTKAFRISLAISEETFKKLDDPGAYKYRFIGKVRVKGKNDPVSIFEIFDGIDENVQKRKIQANRFFEQGMFHYYKKNYTGALGEFRRVLEILPEDGASAFYIDNCLSKINPEGKG